MPSTFDAIYADLAAPQVLTHMGESLTYRPASGGTVALVGMVGGEELIDRIDQDGNRTAEHIRAVTISTVPAGVFGGVANPGPNDRIDIGADTYEVRAVTNRSPNLATLECIRIGSVELARPSYRGRR
jgi:hypothetical protein